MLQVVLVTDLKQESVSLVTTKTVVTARIPESGLVQEALLITKTRVETRLHQVQIMEAGKSEPWDISWSSEKELIKRTQTGYLT